MSKFTKVILILTGCFVGVGIICIMAASALGLKSLDVKNDILARVDQFEESLDTQLDRSYGIELDYSTKEGLNVDVTNGSHNSLDASKEQIPQGLLLNGTFENIRGISIEAGASVVNISYGDVDAVELYHSTKSKVHAEVDEAVLELECTSQKGDEILLVLPKDLQLYELSLETGAGVITVENIVFSHLDAEVGAGELVISVPDKEESFDYDIDCGIGQIVIGDETYTGIVDTQKRNGAQKEMDIDCGAGKVVITFAL